MYWKGDEKGGTELVVARKKIKADEFGLTDAMEAEKLAKAEKIEREIVEALPSTRGERFFGTKMSFRGASKRSVFGLSDAEEIVAEMVVYSEDASCLTIANTLRVQWKDWDVGRVTAALHDERVRKQIAYIAEAENLCTVHKAKSKLRKLLDSNGEWVQLQVASGIVGTDAKERERQEAMESSAPVVTFSNAPAPGLPSVMEFDGDADLDMDEIFGKVNSNGAGNKD